MRKILVTSALPYANGPIHLGHMLEHIQTDIWVRFQKQRGNQCTYVCADDAHGTAIMLRAEQEGITPEELIANMKAAHEKDFQGFFISHDNYHSTHSEENQKASSEIYQKLYDKGYIIEKTVEQLYDPEKQMFLSDRFVKGTCPKCKAEDQYGDNCEVCGSTYKATELIDPISSLSGAVPVTKETIQLFFDLPQFEDFLSDWLKSGRVSKESANKLNEWLKAGLKPWDISREAPYFGFEIPTHPGKYFYVWLDAPIGYVASSQNYCDKNGLNNDDYWQTDSSAELYHFIGKDIVNFHGLFWPAMLTGADMRIPTGIFTHGFVTVDGKKMSKTRGTFINAGSYLDHLPAEALRYYFAAKLTASVDDFDLNLADFVQRVNSDVVGKLVNIASRTANFIKKFNAGKLAAQCQEPEMFKRFADAESELAELYEQREFSKAIKRIMALADEANAYIAEKEPWALAKQEGKEQEVIDVCSLGINLFRQLIIYLKPVLPALTEKVEAFLNVEPLTWQDSQNWLGDHQINKFKPLFQRIEGKAVEAMIEANKQPTTDKKEETKQSNKVKSVKNGQGDENANQYISIDDFMKVDLRVGKIVEANHVEGADKLLQLKVDIGNETRQVFAGIKAAYSPDDIIGKQVVVVANLAPRKMKFGLSEGMVIAAGPGGEDIFLLSPDAGALPGMQVK